MVVCKCKRDMKGAVENFSQNTTFHGVKNIYNSNSVLQRLMWIVFVLACTTAVVYQIIDRVNHYYSLPINVNVKINYNQSLKFPAITICNQNAFRASKAVEHDQYQLIEHMFSRTGNISIADLRHFNATDLSIEQLYNVLAHRKEDFIVSCTWNRNDCIEAFEMVYTDHGVCFMFNQKSSEMTVSSSGVDTGLQLTLNVEQYEYMTGPHDAAGVKMLVHDPRVSPSVHSLGQAIPTGSHAFAGLKFMVINNLPIPHGNCAHKKLEHTEYYTTEDCYISCLVKLASQKCGCRNLYMPHENGQPPVCVLSRYYSCLLPLEEEFKEKFRYECDCPVPCHYSVFDPALSYATISNYLVDNLLTKSETMSLKDKLLKASEATSRADNAKFDMFTVLVQDMGATFIDFNKVIRKLLNYLKEFRNLISIFHQEMRTAYLSKETLYRFQIHSVENNFLRGREAMEERTLRTLVEGFAEFAMLIRRRIKRLFHKSGTQLLVHGRDELFEFICDSLQTRQELANLAKENVTVLLEAFLNGTPVFDYMFESRPRSHNKYIVPKPLMNYAMRHNSYVRKYVRKLSKDLNRIHIVLQQFVGITLEVYENGTLNSTYLDVTFEMFLTSCRTFMFTKSVVYTQGLEYPLKVLNARLEKFEKEWQEFQRKINDIDQYLTVLTVSLQNILTATVPEITLLLSNANNYIKMKTKSLISLADIFLENSTKEVSRMIQITFAEIQTRSQAVNDALDLISQPVEAMWTAIVDDEDMVEYYSYTNNTYFLRNVSEVLAMWQIKLSVLKEYDVSGQLHSEDTHFIEALRNIMVHLERFQNSIAVDTNFVRENFLQLSIFFRQLSYEQVTQQKAYDIFALICDIGGTMGLFIGASMLTIVEIVDLFLIQTPLFKKKAKKEAIT